MKGLTDGADRRERARKRHPILAAIAAALIGLGSISPARAEPFPIGGYYDFGPPTGKGPNFTFPLVAENDSGDLRLSVISSGYQPVALGYATPFPTPALFVHLYGPEATAGGPFRIDEEYSFTARVYNALHPDGLIPDGPFGTLRFSGRFGGEVSLHENNLTHEFTSPTTQSVTVGDYRYTFSFTSNDLELDPFFQHFENGDPLDSWTAFGDGPLFTGAIETELILTPPLPPPPPPPPPPSSSPTAPEPSSCLLLGLAAAFSWGYGRRRRRTRDSFDG